MATKRIPIASASAEQLRDFATLTLGIDVHPNSNAAAIRGKMGAAWDKDYIDIEESDAPAAVVRTTPPDEIPETGKRDAQLVELLIPVQEEAGGKDNVPLSVNGRVMLVPRGKPVKIRRPYFEVLARAVRVVYDQDREGNMLPRFVPQYPYTLIGGITEAEHATLRQNA